ncbi:LOW QUALITY PROTEIN: hypothetical protein OSB04_016201 [Centaurea solstitialis]|uniref:F-box domain-containing protein n=1 Tax=Centaurea solstitialis TaxID=347529 RepID=A0AA38WKU4_9ASTR|nr:LOW QUALITY PROTEIN: hypothetical protein OSB04_016201 [Centaurea solstitialis]
MADFLPHLNLRTLIDPSMEALPAELTMDILSRLPVKTIIHCKLVCKKWRNLVSDSSFVNLHFSTSPTSFIIHHKSPPWIVLNEPGILEWVEIEDKVDRHHLHCDRIFSVDLYLVPILQNNQMCPVGSVNGLVCLWHCFRELNHTYICNPRIHDSPLEKQRFQTDGYVAIACGFGVSSLGEYKVVQTVQREPAILEAEVYTLGTGPPKGENMRSSNLDLKGWSSTNNLDWPM